MRDMLLWTLRGESIVTISFVLYATKIYLGSVYFQQRLYRDAGIYRFLSSATRLASDMRRLHATVTGALEDSEIN